MGCKVVPVSNRKLMKDFINLPFQIYRNDSNWISPLKSEVRRTLNDSLNPYFKNSSLKLFNCYKDNHIVSRISVVINKMHFEKFGVRSAYFGFFESYNDAEAAAELFSAVENYCKKNDIEIIEGPFNPNHYSELGIQLNNFNSRPSFFQTYNPDYYNKLLLKNGYSITKVIHTRKNDSIKKYLAEKFGNNVPKNDNNFTVRSFDLSKMERDLEFLRNIFNDAFSSNWHFLEVSKEEYLFAAKFIKMVTYPELIKFVEYKGQPVGVIQCVLDINPLLKNLKGRAGPIKYLNFLRGRNKIKKVIIYAVGIKESFQHAKPYELLLYEMIKIIKNFEICETTWMSKENIPSIRAAERLGLVPDKEFAIYEKRLI